MKKAAMTIGGLIKKNKLNKSNSAKDIIYFNRNNINEKYRYNNNYKNNYN